ncbi:uncharacterized protein [Setaria viridis]|uniref:uncharacterized protein n=1 Tax=Setaria viridis TaxID=4556 RepID=UPI003B3AA275
MEEIDVQIVSETLGQQFTKNFVFLPAQQTRGGALLAGRKYRGLRFESSWPRILGYLDTVKEAWDRQLQIQNPYLRLHTKIERAGKNLKKWPRSKIGRNELLLCAAKQLVGILVIVQDFRQLSDIEVQLKRDLKARILGMTAIEKIRARQQSRMTYIKAADALSKLFHMQINGRRRKNFIQYLKTEGRIIHSHEEKEGHSFEHYSKQFGQLAQRTHTLDWSRIDLPRLQLENLEQEFSEEGVYAVITDMAGDKAPGPDGYIGVFFKTAWHIIKHDIMAAINFFYQQHG